MLAARQAVSSQIETIKGSVGNTVSISPAGVRGFEGGGEALDADDVAAVEGVDHVTAVSAQLSDRLSTDDTTDLESSIELGSLGQRRANDGTSESTNTESDTQTEDRQMMGPGGMDPMSSITITGLSDISSDSVWGGSTVTWTSGEVFDPSSTDMVAVIGSALAEKNDLAVGDTFTAYDQTLTVVGVYDAGTDFANNGVFVPLSTLQSISDQEGSVTSMTATIDSVDNLETATSAISTALGDSADVTNSQESAETAVSSLQSVSSIALFSLIGAVVAGAIVILLTMIMIVRERRREIGVMKAIGSSNGSIVWQFIVESVTLTAVALVIGVVIGIAAATPLTNALVASSSESTGSQSQTRGPGSTGGVGGQNGMQVGQMPSGGFGDGARQFGQTGVQTAQNITSSVGIATILYGVGLALLIAILGSALPAFLISNIKPAEAMRSE